MGFEVWNLSKVKAVNDFVSWMKSVTEEARSAIAKAKDDMARYYNCRRTPAPDFGPGDKVFIDASNICLNQPSEKLAHHYLGPYTVMEKVGQHAYWLQLPRSMSQLHPVFNMVKLLAAPKDPICRCHSTPLLEPMLVDNNGDEEYKVEAILNSWMFQWKLQYLVYWRSYGYEEHSWVNEEDVHVPEAVQEFYWTNPGAPWWIGAVDFDQTSFQQQSHEVTQP